MLAITMVGWVWLIIDGVKWFAWNFSGWASAFFGEPEVAIEHLTRAMRLCPLDPIMFNMRGGTAFAHFWAGQYEEALVWAERALRERPNYVLVMRVLTAGYAFTARLTEARATLVRLLQFDPTLSVSTLKVRCLSLSEIQSCWQLTSNGRCSCLMREVCSLIWLALVGAFRSRVSLEAENTILRHQLNVLRRQSPKRPTFGMLDRGLYLWLRRCCAPWRS